MSWLAKDLTPLQAQILLDAWHSETVLVDRLRKAGICVHGRSLSTAADGRIYYLPQEYLEPGESLCLECGEVWPTVRDMDEAIERLLYGDG